MKLDLVYEATGVDWQAVSDTLRRVRMAYAEPAVHQRPFKEARNRDRRKMALVFEPAFIQLLSDLGLGLEVYEERA
jgi:hypothetical protein